MNLGPRLNDANQIVWEGWDGHDYEIFKYDNGTVYQLTDNNYNDLEPRNNSQGQIVWSGYNGQDYDIYLYNEGAVRQLSSNAGDDLYPRINNLGQVSWEGRDADGNSAIYVAVPTATRRTFQQLTSNTVKDRSPDLNADGIVVWKGWDGTDYEIYYYDGAVHQITDNTTDDSDPRINLGGDIVWTLYLGDGTSQVMHYNYTVGGTPTVVSPWPATLISTTPARSSMNTTTLIYLHDSQCRHRLSDPRLHLWRGPPHQQPGPGRLVCLGRHGGLDSRFSSTPTPPAAGHPARITDNSYTDEGPRINDHGQILWSRDDGDGWQTYLYDGGVISQVFDTST